MKLCPQLLAAYEQLATPMWVLDYERYEHLWANGAGLDLWIAPSLEEFVERPIGAPSPTATAIVEQIRERLGRGDTYTFVRAFQPLGAERRVRVTAQPAQWCDGRPIALFQAWMAEQAQLESSARGVRAASTWGHSTLPALLLDASGGIVQQNPVALKIFGEAENIGTLLAVREDGRRLLGAETTVQRIRTRVVTRAGSRWYEFICQRIPDRQITDGLVLVQGIDVTDDVASLEDMEQRRDQALALARTKSALLATVSHELRTPMHGVLGLTSVLLDSSLDDDQRSMMELVERSSRSLLGLLDDLLVVASSAAQPGRNPVAVFEPVALSQDILHLLRPSIARGVTVRREVEDTVPRHIEGHLPCFRQVLTNLLGNAAKFTTEGQITIRLRWDEGLVLHVEDTGPGIPQEELPSLFEPFARADCSPSRATEGVGLGLAIVRRLVDAAGGEMRCSSEPGSGTRFRVWLPATAVVRVEPPPVQAPEHGALRVLVVEDNPVNRLVAERWLGRAGHKVAVVDSGEAALESLQSDLDLPELILMDLHMPGMSGLEATRCIRALPGPAAHLRIVALSADTGTATRALARSSGMDDFLSKPLDPAALARVLREAAPPLRATTAVVG